MEYLVLATSLRTDSHSRILARHVTEAYAQRGGQVAFVDLRNYPLPLCDGGPAYDDPGVAALSALIAEARVVTLAVPIYNYDVNAAAKNLVELTGLGRQDRGLSLRRWRTAELYVSAWTGQQPDAGFSGRDCPALRLYYESRLPGRATHLTGNRRPR
jgi:NAD(P)H-dependent FMN reductase